MSNINTTVWLDELDISKMMQGWRTPQACKSVTGKPLRIAGREYARGVGTHTRSVLWLDLNGEASRFQAAVGVDDAAEGTGTMVFAIYGDDRELFNSGVVSSGQPALPVEVDLTGIRRLILTVGDAAAGVLYGHANWVEARFTVCGASPQPSVAPPEPAVILTPKPGPLPRINGPRIYGCRPGHPFLYRIPATGDRPMTFSAGNLPPDLALDPHTGIITGRVNAKGQYDVILTARNAQGVAKQKFSIICGDTLALTPPMGWNDWYAHESRITGALMREATETLVASGMADFGYSYISVDDCWMNAPQHADAGRVGPLRDENGYLIPNSYFPDMKDLIDFVHEKGLKFGIYSSPGPLTCAGFAGSHGHEEQDARQWADWGVDLLKYDWCTYWDIMGGKTREHYIHPYRIMGDLLKQQGRDILFNLCQYGMCNPWEWAAEIGGHTWRTTGDVGMEKNQALPGALRIGMVNARYHEFAKPGAWNDPDYLILGPCEGPQALTANEQYAYISMWALMAAPLFFSGSMSKLDEFTLNLLCNHEIIEVNQDPLGKQARIVKQFNEDYILAKQMEDGSLALGMFNLGEVPHRIRVNWNEIGLNGCQRVRDLWRQIELGTFEDHFEILIQRHGVMVTRFWPAGQQ
jgi:alpha-galactosidase